MRKWIITLLAGAALLACKHPKTLAEQLRDNFSVHLQRLDTAASIDSVRIIRTVAATPRLGNIIDDTLYVREYSGLKRQLAGARQRNDKDSVEFYRYEINYMEKELDSISRLIPLADTTRRFGNLIVCAYYVSRHDKKRIDSTIIFIDSTQTMRATEFLDSALKRTIRNLR